MEFPFKKVILFIHRWLGLITGLIVFIVCITGCLFAFQQEFTQWYRHDMMYTHVKKSKPLPVKELQKKAAKALGVNHLNFGLITYKNPHRNWSAIAYRLTPNSWTYFGSMEKYKTVYINPYTGNIAGIANEKHDFFQIVKGLHWSLLLATPIGQPVVVWCTVIFMILLISGFILWWPKRWNKTGRKQSFSIKWKSTWRRINYDLHNVLGFYFLIITLILCFTGLYWLFPNFTQKSLHFIGNGEFTLPHHSARKIIVSSQHHIPKPDPLQAAYRKARSRFPNANSITFLTPSDSKSPIQATVRPYRDTFYAQSTLQFDQHSGKVIRSNLYQAKNSGEKLVAMNYDIHVGAIAGLPGKIIAFLASLACTSLPVTGFIIWWDREKRKWRKNM